MHSIRRLFTENWRDVSKTQKMRRKNQKKNKCTFSVFPVFVCAPFYPTGINIGYQQAAPACFETCWKASRDTTRAKLRRKVRSQCGETARQRRTSLKNLCAQGARASGSPVQQFQNQIESTDCLLSNAPWSIYRTCIVQEILRFKVEAPDFWMEQDFSWPT